MSNITRIAVEMDSRMVNLRVFYPIFHINSSQSTLESPYNLTNLCLALLAILLEEGKLQFKNLTLDEIAVFMREYILIAYNKEISEIESNKIVGYLLDRLHSDKALEFFYYSCSKRRVVRDSDTLKLVEQHIVQNRIEYQISTYGLDFFLKTKEFPEESLITISLLLLRKQIEKKMFYNALQTVKNLNVQVKKRLAEKIDLLALFSSGGSDFSNKYQSFRETIMGQFEEESVCFSELNTVINETREEYLNKKEENKITEKDEKHLEVLYDIEIELNKATKEHRRLLEESVIMPEDVEKIRKMRIKAAHGERFNFLGQLERIVKDDESPEVLQYIINPLLSVRPNKTFNPIKALSPQRLVSGEKEDDGSIEVLDAIDRKYLDDIIRLRIQNNFRYFIVTLLRMLEIKRSFDLKEWYEKLTEWYGPMSATSADIVSFIVAINHTDPENSTKRISLQHIHRPVDEEKIDLPTIICIVLTLGSFSGLPSAVEINPAPDEDIQLGDGIKATNLIFEGVN